MRLLTDAVLTRLNTARTIGDAHAPTDTTRPYGVLWPLFAADFDGPLGDYDADAWWHYQVTCVGDTREQAQGLADELRATIDTAYTVTGFAVGPVKLEDSLPVERDDAVQPPVFYQSFTVKIFATPS